MRLIVLVIIVVLRVTTASAQTQPEATPSPDAIAAAKELTAISLHGLVEEVTQGIVAQMWPQLERSFGPQIDAATSAELRSEAERSTQQFVIDSMQDMPLIYARYFTADELRQLAAFYKTPLGAKVLRVPTASAQTQPQATPSPDAIAAAKELTAILSHGLAGEMAQSEAVIDSIQDEPLIYARYFTADELRQLAAFYKTPLGAKALSQSPRVMADEFATLVPEITVLQQQLQGRLQSALQKHGSE